MNLLSLKDGELFVYNNPFLNGEQLYVLCSCTEKAAVVTLIAEKRGNKWFAIEPRTMGFNPYVEIK